MKKTLIIMLTVCIVLQNWAMAQNKKNNLSHTKQKTENGKGKILSFYLQYSDYTNPGEYEKMYDNLPDSLSVLCKLIKAQLIHPMADLPMYRDQIPVERSCEDLKYPTVNSLLAGLQKYNSAGLICARKPADRLVVSCRYHAILLASILKHKGIPVRLRYGFANYLFPGYHIYHVICQVWNEKESRWMLVDPDRQMVDIPAGKFEFSNEVWVKLQQGKLDPKIYGVPTWWGAHTILDVVCHDLASVLGNEHTYLDRPLISADSTMNVMEMPNENIVLMNKISSLMTNVDENLCNLKKCYEENKMVQFKNSNTVNFKKLKCN